MLCWKIDLFFAGISAYNILKHKENTLPDEFKMPTRYVLQAGAQIYVGDYGKAYISLTNMGQAKANETTIGGAYGIQLGETDIKNEINFGLWYRMKDAARICIVRSIDTVGDAGSRGRSRDGYCSGSDRTIGLLCNCRRWRCRCR